jgi:predicted RNase H-like HicB family nuclease
LTSAEAEVERDESGTWIATVPALRGVHTHARTLASLRRYLQDAIAPWLEVDLLDAGERSPHVDRDSIAVELHVKLPPAARRAAETAKEAGAERRRAGRVSLQCLGIATRRKAKKMAAQTARVPKPQIQLRERIASFSRER